MNICYFTCSTKYGGLEKVTVDISNSISLNNNVIVLVPNGCQYKDKFIENVTLIEYKSLDRRLNPFLYLEIYFILKKYKIDLVHTHASKATQIFYYLNKFMKLIHVATKHNARKGKIFNKIKYVTAVSNDAAKTIKNDNVKIIYNGIKASKLENNNLKNQIFTITAIGRLDKIKGFDTLIKEFSKIKNSAILQIVGEGEEYNNLISLIKELSLENKVSLLGFRKDIPTIINNSDLVVMSSLSEGFSIVMIESIFYAKVFISTKVSGCKDILSSKLLIEDFNIASKIDEVINNYQEFTDEFLKIRNKYKDKFTLENISKEYFDYYLKILELERR
jgi:glycosyltransferase involved in cell wall biosynthesis